MARLSELYKQDVAQALKEEFSLGNDMAVPRIDKVVISMGVGRAVEERKILQEAVQNLSIIAGQRPMITRARRSVSNFKLREGVEIGCMVTLRGARMYEFLDRLLNVALPRVRDFRGMGVKFDPVGNYSLGISDLSIFPEVDLDKVEYKQGMNVTIVIRNSDSEKSRSLLTRLGMPFRK